MVTQYDMIGVLETQPFVCCLTDITPEQLLLLVLAFELPPMGSSLGGEL